jgi:hypothetical protein
MENGRMNDYTSADLMAAILEVRDATAHGYARLDEKIDAKVDGLRHEMNRRFDRLLDDMDGRFARVNERFDRMDERFDRLEGRVATIAPHGPRPAS